MSNKEILLKKIAEARTEMCELITKKNKLTDSDVIKLSQKLDKLLNEYNEYLKKE